jgi:23S rRNA (cytosine1962-C5)-methyltransferase
LYGRILKALQRRQIIEPFRPNHAIRIIHGESDGLPGLIVDRYAATLVVQFLSCGAELWREIIVGALQELTDAACIYERSDVDVRQLEGLSPRVGLLRGSEPDKLIRIVEGGLDFLVDVRNGHKTGFYLDQASNRLKIRFLVADRSVLDCFSYSGGFSANALEGGARSLVMVDESGEALSLAMQNLHQNGLQSEHVSAVEGNVFQVLRNYRDRGARFDMIILDPPKFAHSASQIEKASRGYKDINLMAFKLLNPGGYLVTFSCSGGISADLFQKIVAGAALDAGVDGKIIDRLHQNFDHPVGLAFPEGEYLKGLVVQIA